MQHVHMKLLPIFFVMPWMSLATSSWPDAMSAFSWPRRSRFSLRESSICPWPSCSFTCCFCRALWPSSSFSKEAEVSSFSSSWPSCYKKQNRNRSEQFTSWFFAAENWALPSGPSWRPAGSWLWRWARWLCALLCAWRAADGSRSKLSALCCWRCGRRSTCRGPCRLCTLL